MWFTPFMHRALRLAIPAVAIAIAASDIGAQQQPTEFTVVSSFDAAAGRPNGVIQARDGLFYGTTGIPNSTPFVPSPIGSVFRMDAEGARTTLHTFIRFVPNRLFDGVPLSNLLEGADGLLYGTTYNVDDTFTPPGQIFRISTAGDFETRAHAHWLAAGLIQARDGRLYGTSTGGTSDAFVRTYGEVFRVEATGGRTVLHNFTGLDTATPAAELLEIDDGSLYGTAMGGLLLTPPGTPQQPIPGAIFRVDLASGAVTIRHRFSGPDGAQPTSRLIQGTDGLIYGTTSTGGAYGLGTVFSLDAADTLTTVHHFAGHDGANPSAGVIQGFDGRLYGTTTNGGVFGVGTVFVVNVTGGLTTLHDFASSDGANPVTELIQTSDGTFYGATPSGGDHDHGVVFRVRVGAAPVRYFEIVSRNSGKCLDVFGASPAPAAAIIQWTCHGGHNQRWRLEPAGGGAFRIIARHSGQALDVFGALVDDVTPVIQWPVHGGDNQVWTFAPASGGHLQIVARHSGKAMDVEFASPNDGARVIQFTPHGGANQQWLLRGVESTHGD